CRLTHPPMAKRGPPWVVRSGRPIPEPRNGCKVTLPLTPCGGAPANISPSPPRANRKSPLPPFPPSPTPPPPTRTPPTSRPLPHPPPRPSSELLPPHASPDGEARPPVGGQKWPADTGTEKRLQGDFAVDTLRGVAGEHFPFPATCQRQSHLATVSRFRYRP